MFIFRTAPKKSLLLLALSSTMIPALACGPDFPQQLLANRNLSLTQLPEPIFASEISDLATKITTLPQPEKKPLPINTTGRPIKQSAPLARPNNSC